MKKLLLLLIAITTVGCNNTTEPAKVVAEDTESAAATNPNDFEELKKLEGKWAGTLERTDGSSDELTLDYTVTSNGSALLEESDTGGTEMLSIFNFQNDQLLLTHYCGLQNKPIYFLIHHGTIHCSFHIHPDVAFLKRISKRAGFAASVVLNRHESLIID